MKTSCDQTKVPRRVMLKSGLSLMAGCALSWEGCRGNSHHLQAVAWLRENLDKLPDLACALANMERAGAVQDFPTVIDRLRYITTIEMYPGIIYCVLVFPAGEPVPLEETMTIAARAGCPVVACGWSDDRRVAGFFAVGDAARMKRLVVSIAPPAEAWARYDSLYSA